MKGRTKWIEAVKAKIAESSRVTEYFHVMQDLLRPDWWYEAAPFDTHVIPIVRGVPELPNVCRLCVGVVVCWEETTIPTRI